jgi:hypothetical protein
MDVLDIIEADHDAIESLIEKLAGIAGSTADRDVARAADLVEQLAIEIELHSRSEELVLYRACHQLGGDLRAFALAGVHHHHLEDAMLADLRALRPGDDGKLAAAVGVLHDVFVRHARHGEEATIFPVLRHAMPDAERTALGRALLAERERIRPQIEHADRPPRRRPHGPARGLRAHPHHH